MMKDKEIKRLGILYGMEQDLWKLVKSRAAPVVILTAVITAGGLWVAVELVVQRAVETPLQALQKEIVRAEVQAEAAKRSSDTAKASSEQIAASLSTLNTTLEGLGEQARVIDAQFRRLSGEINAASENARIRSQQDFNAVQRRITALEALVKQIGEDSAASRKATGEYARQIAALEGKFEREQRRFAENSAYTVSVFFDPSKRTLATELQARLAGLGFRTPLHEIPSGLPKGSTLTYPIQGEAKAQEVATLLKPVLKDLQEKKALPIEYSISKKLSEALSKSDASKAGINLIYPMYGWTADLKAMQLMLGAN